MSDTSYMGTIMLAWLSRDPERLARLCRETGYDAQTLKAEAGGEALSLAVLEYMLADESLLLQFCAETHTPPEEPLRIWRRAQGEF